MPIVNSPIVHSIVVANDDSLFGVIPGLTPNYSELFVLEAK